MPYHYLELIQAKQKTEQLEIFDKVFIGRSCTGIDETKRLVISDEFVSRYHALISWSGSHLKITDMSKNGTWVNNVRVLAGASHELADGDLIRIGSATIRVSCPSSPPLHEDEEESTVISTEQVVVSNVVADIRDFSSVVETEDSSKVYALLSRIFEILSSIVEDYKGTIKDYAGDSVYAFWDHRFIPSKEQAVLACQAAIQQARTVDTIGPKFSGTNSAFRNLSLGWGITTGKVTISHYKSRAGDMAIVGDSTNLAFRLSEIANKQLPSEILMCSQTANLIRDRLPVIDIGFVPIRGRSGQENIFGIKLK